MARIRSLHPGFFTDERLISITMAARLFFLGLGGQADDKGVFEWKPVTLKMRIFPADNVDVEALLGELMCADAIAEFEIDGRKYGAIRNFRKFQRPKSPNDVHPITPDFRAYVGLEKPLSETPSRDAVTSPQIGETAASANGASAHQGRISRQMEEGGGKRGRESQEPRPADDAQSRLLDVIDDGGQATSPEMPQARYFRRGKEVLGNRAGGTLKQLLDAKYGSVAQAIAVIEAATEAENPREYVYGAIRRMAQKAEQSKDWACDGDFN